MDYNVDNKTSYKIAINDLRIWLHLGYSEEEKHHPQLISFNIELIFKSPPSSCSTDQLEDTVCYAKIIQYVQDLCQNRKFNLIEYLATEVYRVINDSLGDKKQDIFLINVTICKISPPIANVHGGVSFTYCNSPTNVS
jgi:dihydroneopterin aldolase